jgi:uncharacterized membrane protein YgcG
MRKLFFFFTLFVIVFFSWTSVIHSQEKISEFRSEIKVNKDATIDIVETITYEPPLDDSKHGIMWEIPSTYSVFGFQRKTPIKINSVEYYPLSDTKLLTKNLYSQNYENGWTILKIGDPNKYIDGTQVYVIDYTMKYSGILYEDEFDEVYLNVIGPGWSMPIENASARIKYPSEIIEVICFSGIDKSQEQNCSYEYEGSELNVRPMRTLSSNEGYTVSVKLPKGSIDNTTSEQILKMLISNIGILLPIPVGIFLFGFVKKKVKNKKLTVIPQYKPKKDSDSLTSSIIIKNIFNSKNISALLIEMAQKGYFKIREYKKNKYEFVKLEKDYGNLPDYISELLEAIFTHGDVVPMKKLTNFYTTSNKAFVKAQRHLKSIEAFSTKKRTLRAFLILSAFFGLFLLFPSLTTFVYISSVGTYIGILISLVIVLIFAFMVDTRSETGNEMYHFLLGLKMYIETAEKHRIEFHNNPEKYKEVFEKLLPYAMIFNLEKKWAKQFEDIYTKPPDWYEGDFTSFNTVLLVNSLSSFNRNISVSSKPSSSGYGSSGGHRSGGWSSGSSGFGGGGFSGGGGGGSGGSSW